MLARRMARKDEIEALGPMRGDVLGFSMLGCLRRAFALLAVPGGPALTMAMVP